MAHAPHGHMGDLRIVVHAPHGHLGDLRTMADGLSNHVGGPRTMAHALATPGVSIGGAPFWIQSGFGSG